MTYEELSRLARQSNWVKSRILYQLLKKVLEIMPEEDYVNSYVKHLFNDDNNNLDIFILTNKEKLLCASYVAEQKSIRIKILDIAGIDEIELREHDDGTLELDVVFTNGFTIALNSRDNFDHEHKNHIPDFARSLYHA